jgi:hypothetical protein
VHDGNNDDDDDDDEGVYECPDDEMCEMRYWATERKRREEMIDRLEVRALMPLLYARWESLGEVRGC